MGPRVLTEREQQSVLDFGVMAWRFDRLMDAGYPVEDALALAVRGDIDLHTACELLVQGCPLDRAMEILV